MPPRRAALNRADHIAEARDSAQTAERLFSEGRDLQAMEIVWCSVKHAVNAVAVLRGWRHATYGHKKGVIERLEKDEGHPDLIRLLAIARNLHIHSDNGALLDAAGVTQSRRESATLVERLLSIAET